MKSILSTLICLALIIPIFTYAGATSNARVTISNTTYNGIPMIRLRGAFANRYNDIDPNSYVSVTMNTNKIITIRGGTSDLSGSGSQYGYEKFECIIRPSSHLYDMAKSILFNANSSTEIIVLRYPNDSIAPSNECQTLYFTNDSRLLP